MELLTQERLRDLFKDITGSRATTDTVRSCIIAGLPYTVIGKRKYFNKDSVLEWLKKREHQSPTYITTNKQRR